MKTTLYKIENEYQQIIAGIIDNDGELTPELEQQLQITEQQLQSKAVAYSFIIKEVEAEIEIINNEITRLNDFKTRRKRAAETLKQRISDAMQLFSIEEIKTPLIKLNFRKSESVEIINAELLDSEYLTIKTTVTPDKVKIKSAINSGADVQGAILQQNKNLQIK